MIDMELALAWKTQQGYVDCSTSLAEHDKQIRDEIIDSCISKIDDVYGYYHEVPMVLDLLEQMKGEQNND